MPACYRMNNVIRSFDRIDHTLAIITLMRFGLAYNAAHTLFQVMKNFLHCIKTGYGISGPIYGNKSIPSASCEQGNGLGMTLCTIISTVISIMCKKTGHGMKCFTSVTKLPISFYRVPVCWQCWHSPGIWQCQHQRQIPYPKLPRIYATMEWWYQSFRGCCLSKENKIVSDWLQMEYKRLWVLLNRGYSWRYINYRWRRIYDNNHTERTIIGK